jgi:hypothetical protein
VNWSVSNQKATLFLFKLELALVDFHVKEEQLLICSGNTELICGYGLTSSIHCLVDGVVNAEGVHFFVQGLHCLHFGTRSLDDLDTVRD